MTAENTYFIGEDNVISIGTISMEKAMREINTEQYIPVEDKSEKASFIRSPSYNGDLSVDDISNNEISAIVIKNDEPQTPNDFVTPHTKKEEEDIRSAFKSRNQSVQLKKNSMTLGGFTVVP